ncbi:MAG: AAA family ATPase [Methanomassiliicoccaceae archaeon]|nr:AAA family ATPase [Methanomassiliicoccaceae archaeon]
MLIRFRIGNFLSFNETQELSMISGETRDHTDHIHKFEEIGLLRTSAVYGANASGKSNLIKAFEQSKKMIVFGIPIRSNRYFRSNAANKDKLSYFEYEFENNGKYYSYGFEFFIFKQKVESEWLYELKIEGENKILFQRNGNEIHHDFKGEDGERMRIYIADMKNSDSRKLSETTLFLTMMSGKLRTDEKGFSVFSDVFNWFSNKMKVFGAKTSLLDTMNISDHERETVVRLLGAMGTGITGIRYEPIENAERRFGAEYLDHIRRNLVSSKGSMFRSKDPLGGTIFASLSENNELMLKRLLFTHEGPDALFEMEEESEGTQRLYDLLAMIVSKDKDNVYLLDELDLKLHPKLTCQFVRTFLGEKAGTKNQLIFTTHGTYLMEYGLLRRDEIWFIEKKGDESSLYSLEEYKERSDRRIDKAYMDGRYGGVPEFLPISPIFRGRSDEAGK